MCNIRRKMRIPGRFARLCLSLILAVLLAVLPAAAAMEEDRLPQDQPEAGVESEEPVSLSGDELEDELEDEPEDDPGDVPEETPEEAPDAEPAEESDPVDVADVAETPSTVQKTALATLNTGGHKAYMSGYSGGYFMPNKAMTRAEVAKTIYNLLKDKPASSGKIKYSDVPTSHWAYKAVDALTTLKVVNGSKGKYRPDDSITRAEFVAIVNRCFDLKEGTKSFPDVPEDFWARKDIMAVKAAGWIGGYPDGTFRPWGNITRAEVVKIMNSALGRRGSGFAADAEKQEFMDVPPSHWAYKEIAEAANPLPGSPVPGETPPSTDNNSIKVGSTVKVNNATGGLYIRSGPGTGYAILTTVYNGTLLTVTDISKAPWYGVKTSAGLQGYASGEFLVLSDSGTTVPVQNGSISAGTMTLAQYQSFRLDATASTNVQYMKWNSTNRDVARVGYTIDYSKKEQSAIVYAGQPGTATLTYTDASGSVRGTCKVTVNAAEPVRFAYTDNVIESTATAFNLLAITDSTRKAVRFDLTGPASLSYTTDAYKAENRTSAKGLPENKTRVFSKSVQLTTPGTYTVKAYSSTDGKSFSKDCYTFTLQVKQNFSYTAVSGDSRIASGKLLKLMVGYEGYRPEIEDDNLASGNPTVGHGLVIQKNTVFYNNMTKSESYAQLIRSTNEGDYVKLVQNFQSRYKIKMSQAQFDSLVDFAYGFPGYFYDGSLADALTMILNMVVPPKMPASGVVNVTNDDYGAAPLYSSYNNLAGEPKAKLAKNVKVTVSKVQPFATNKRQEVWYYVTCSNGTTGWIPSGYVKLNGTHQIDLTYADSASAATEFLRWNKVVPIIYEGLLYRRLCGNKIFFFGNYNEGNNTANWSHNTYGFVYPKDVKDYEKK